MRRLVVAALLAATVTPVVSSGDVQAIYGCQSGMRTTLDYAWAYCSSGSGSVQARATCKGPGGGVSYVYDWPPHSAGQFSRAYCSLAGNGWQVTGHKYITS